MIYFFQTPSKSIIATSINRQLSQDEWARFDNNKQYAFLRKKDGDILLVVCNFNGNAVDIDVKIPQHAVDFLEIPEKKYTATDLLTGDKKYIIVKGDHSIDMDVPAYSARVWKFTYRKPAKK